MAKFLNRLKRIFSKERLFEASRVEELRIAFRERYHHFKLLLNANNKALEIMSEIEGALLGTSPFGMAFVRSRSTSISTNVWQIIKHLNDLSPGKYEELYDRFKDIQKNINPFIRPKESLKTGPLVIPLASINKDFADQVGSKMANLGEIGARTGLKISNGFAVTARAYWRFMEHNDLQTEINRLLQTMEMENQEQLYRVSAGIQRLITQATLPEDLEGAVSEQYRLLEQSDGAGIKVAMRSSALGEDMPGVSFAGQYRSELNVSRENILDSYKGIVASKYSPTAITYRMNRGMRDEDIAMAVGCMSMVDALSGGVTYSSNFLDTWGKSVVINSVWGLPKPVVDGSTSSDLFLVSREDPLKIISKEVAFKDQKFICYAEEGVCRMDLTGEMGDKPSLSDGQALEVARLALDLEEYYGAPQDIEWALKPDGSIIILQCRPLQDAGRMGGLDGKGSLRKGPWPVLMEGGFTASPGAAAGPAFIVKKDADILRFPEGAVLVTTQALPRLAVLLNRVSAIVTEQGGITGHLANVAREFGVPAIFGMRGAIDKLKKKELITLDADGLRIYEGRIDILLDGRQKSKNLMEGSPVFESLKGVAQHIVPLNLLDPDAPEFRPARCRTFHDITRFCHEKVVDEMFRFGKDHHFPERSSKQLFVDVPMQWWVLNLDDGFTRDVEGKYVRPEDIASIPMLALWEGITALPWEGPPPLDGKGFMSVMFQATTNPALAAGSRTGYGDRNYFMISRNYCSLSSRLGFHFSIIEAMVSERPGENYISFQFKGGAADGQRRYGRVMFIREILEEYDFRVDVREDNLIARLEGYEEDFIKSRLKILGYLTIHTRQLDMIMSNAASVEYYRSKIRKDISSIL